MKEKEVKQSMISLLPCADPFLAGATHYYQYDLAISSTPRNCVDVFALGAAGSNAPVTHAVFPIEIPLIMANEKHNIPLLDLHGPTLAVCTTVLSPLPNGFNKSVYSIKVVRIDCTCNDAPPLGKINPFFHELLISYLYSDHFLFYTRFSSRLFRGNAHLLYKSINARRGGCTISHWKREM
jgi:hypothetical protein